MTTQNYTVQVNSLVVSGSTSAAWKNTLIDVTEGDLLTFQASGEVRPWHPDFGDIGFTGPDGYFSHGYGITAPVLPSARFMSLVGGIGLDDNPPAYIEEGGAVFYIGSNQTIAAPATGRLWLIVNDVRDRFDGNDDTAFTVNIAVRTGGPYEPENQGECPAFTATPTNGPNPINLHNGEKTLTETDISLQTPAGRLSFTRIYRQYQQDNPDYQTLMGLGWTHNHAFQLNITGSSPNRSAQVRWSDGSLLLLDEVDGFSPTRFNARRGSTAYLLNTDTSPNEYTLFLEDHSSYVFQLSGSTWRMMVRQWANGEVWSYDYDSNHRLTDVSDGYGRQLQLSYINNSQFDDGLIWRVGDQTAAGLDGSTPSGRYVELAYTEEPGSQALLTSVRDVRGQTWSYDYYGFDAGETEAIKLNLLTEVRSPSVDTDGDGTLDGSLTLQRLTYSFSANTTELAVNGDMETDDSWTAISGAAPTTNERSTAQVDTGTYSRHVVTSAANQGIEGEAWRLFKGRIYTITARVYRVSGQVQMQVGSAAVFTVTSTGTGGAWETLSVTEVTADTSDDACRLQFVAHGGAAEFYLDNVSIVEANPLPTQIVQELGVVTGQSQLLIKTFDFHPDRDNFTRETVDEHYVIHVFDNGLYQGTMDMAEAMASKSLGETYRALANTDANGNTSVHSWSADGRRLESVKNALGQTTQFFYDHNEALTLSQDAEQRATLYLYEKATHPRLSTRVLVLSSATNLVKNGTMEAPSTSPTSVGEWVYTSSEPTTTLTNANTDPAHVASGRYSLYVNASSANQGIQSNGHVLTAEQVYLITARVFPTSGAVRLWLANEAGTEISGTATVSQGTGAWETLVAVYKASNPSPLPNVSLRITAEGGAAQFYVDEVYMLDNTLIQQWQEFNYDAQGRILDEWLINPTEGSRTAALTHTRRTYYTTGTGNGLLQSVLQEDLGGSNDVMTTYFYDDAGRVMQTNQSSNFGNCTRSRTLYDSAGNVIASICNFDLDVSGTPSASSGQASAAFDEDDTLHWSATGINGEWLQYDFGVDNEKTITSVALTAMETDLNQLPQDFTIEASNDGNSWTTLQTVTGETNWAARETRVFTFVNPTAYRYWRLAFTAANGASNVSLAEVDFVPTNYPATVTEALNLRADTANPDQNRLTVYEYDTLGRRVRTTLNAGTSEAQTTLTLYDALGRVIRTITNYVSQNNSAPGAWRWNTADARWDEDNGTPIDHASDLTQNLIQDTVYNARGLVESQRDVLGKVTRYIYNAVGRPVKLIRNYVSNGVDPALWEWANNQWEDGSPNHNPINHGTNNDQNLITTSQYDAQGNLVKVMDTLGHMTFTVYDALNRVVKVVGNAKSTATVDHNPEDQGYDAANDPRSSSYVASTLSDRDLITRTEYDAMGRVVRTYDELDRCTRLGYDPLGRQVYTVVNWQASGSGYNTDPATWVWDNGQQRWEDNNGVAIPFGTHNDQNILTHTFYDHQGKVLYTQDINGSQTRLVYDGLGRQVKSIQNYVAQGTSDPATWVWDGTTDNRWERSDGTAIDHGTKNDQNIITETQYDSDGRVMWTRDVLGRQQRPVYDAVGRRTRLVQNWQSGGTGYSTDPTLWVWDNGQERWEDNNGTEIPHGSNTDLNIVTETLYDDFSRVVATFDPRHNQTRLTYNLLGRRTRTVTNYVDEVYSASVPDEDLIQTVTYDLAGRVVTTTDPAGQVTRFVYDQLGRRIRSIANYVVQGSSDPATWVWDGTTDNRWEQSNGTAISHGTAFDQNLISDTSYNRAGQVVATRDARGTLTSFTYDAAGRRQVLMQASGSSVELQHYTVYDKGGRVLRSVRNWQPSGTGYSTDPAGWLWDATQLRWEDGANAVIPHGTNSDQNLVTGYSLDALGRVLSVTDPVGNLTSTIYYTDGRVKTNTDAAGYNTEHRYDALRRLTRVVQAYQSNGVDPANWLWDATQWEDGSNNAINHGTRYDRNIIVDLTLDKVGRRTSLQDTRGNVTTYTYDQLNRRTGLTNPLSQAWTTTHSDIAGQRTRQTATDPLTFQIQQDFDRLGRLVQLSYLGESTPKATPDVTFTYDAAGNRTLMSESDGVDTIRNTRYTFDQARRVSAVEFDTNGDSTYDQTVSYTYDQGGLRTELRLPDNKTITYTYDVRGQLVSLTDWDSQASRYAYDQSGRLVAVERPNGMHSRYTYDAASRLRQLRHTVNNKVLGHFAYEVDARGNRTKAVEMLLGTGTGTQTITSDNSLVDYYQGSWSTSGLFMQTADPGAKLRLLFFGKQATLTLGTDVDHGISDIYVNNRLWQSIDSYATSPGEDGSIVLNLASEGPHALEIRNTADKHPNATGRKLRFKQLAVSSGPLYDLHTIHYAVDDTTPGYDALGRVVAAKYHRGGRTSGPTFREYAFSYDVAGNRTQQIETLNGTPTTTNYSYDTANRLSQVGAQAITYDAAGRLTDDGTLTYEWDQASHLLSAGGSSYAYNGVGQRVTETVGANVTQYLLDTQSGLYNVLTATTGAAVDRYVHGPTGIHAQKDSSNNWEWMLQDGLGSVRSVLDNSLGVLHMQHYAPYGASWGTQGITQTPFGFTAEPTDQNDLVYLRARYYNPTLGVFPSLDPLEGDLSQLLSLNRYVYVQGNPANWIDPSGLIGETPEVWNPCDVYRKTNRRSCNQILNPEAHWQNFADPVAELGYESWVCDPICNGTVHVQGVVTTGYETTIGVTPDGITRLAYPAISFIDAGSAIYDPVPFDLPAGTPIIWEQSKAVSGILYVIPDWIKLNSVACHEEAGREREPEPETEPEFYPWFVPVPSPSPSSSPSTTPGGGGLGPRPNPNFGPGPYRPGSCCGKEPLEPVF